MQLKERPGRQMAVLAAASNNARILWAVLTPEGEFGANRLPDRPGPGCTLSQRPAT